MPRIGQQRGGMADHARAHLDHDKGQVQRGGNGKGRAVGGAMVMMAVAMAMPVIMMLLIPVIMPAGMVAMLMAVGVVMAVAHDEILLFAALRKCRTGREFAMEEMGRSSP